MRKPGPVREEDEFYESLFALCNGYLGLLGATDQVLAGNRYARLLVRGAYKFREDGPSLIILPALAVARLTTAAGQLGWPGNGRLVHEVDEQTATLRLGAWLQAPDGHRVQILTRTSLPPRHHGIILSITHMRQPRQRQVVSVRLCLPSLQAVATAGMRDIGPGAGLMHSWTGHAPSGIWLSCAYHLADGESPLGAEQDSASGHVVSTAATWSVVLAVGEGGSREAAAEQSASRLREFLNQGPDTTACGRSREARPLTVRGRGATAVGARYAMFALAQSADREAWRQNIPPRGLTSDHHGGNFFFNTDVFMVPFFSLTDPSVARSLLRQRIAELPAALSYAGLTGCSGARYPLVSAWDGRPVGGQLEASRQAHFVSACVLYGLHRYLAATSDWAFVAGAGADMVAQIARYYAAALSADQHTLRHVTGFDEYHRGVDHHWATTYLARWSLLTAASISARLAADHSVARATPSEIARWSKIADAVYLPSFDSDSEILPEFDGYLDLPDVTAPGHRARIRRAGEPSGPASPRPDARSRQIKQADVVLVQSMFLSDFTARCRAANLDFYEPRTAHASSLSLPPHAAVAASLRRPAVAASYLRASLRYNLDYHPKAGYRNGIHLACYAGAWLAVVDGFLGIRADGDVLIAEPWWPRSLPAATVSMRWRGRRLLVHLSAGGHTVLVTDGDPITAGLAGGTHELVPGRPVTVPSAAES